MKSKRVAIGIPKVLNIVLEEDVATLDEVVIVGYGTLKKSDLSGAVGTIDETSLDKQLNKDVASAIQGKHPGVSVENMGELQEPI